MSHNKKISAPLQIFLTGISIVLLLVGLLWISKLVSHEDKKIHTSSNSDITVIIDAGHGGEDGGASSADGILEKDLNLSLSPKLYEIFSSAGISTVMTRNEDKLLYDTSEEYQGRKKILDMRERVKIVSDCENPVFISIHMNSFPEEKYSGLQVYFSSNDPRSETLARGVQNTVHNILQKENKRKIKCGKDIFLLDRISDPAILIECGFLSNPTDAALLSDTEYQNELAVCIFLSVMREIQ